MTPAMVRNVIFDLDGTLVDSLPGIQWSVDAALEACGLPPRRRELRPMIGPPIRSILSDLTETADGPALDGLERAFRRSYDSEGWRRTVCQPGAAALLEKLRALSIGMWIVTNKPALATGMILTELGISALFSEVACPDSQPGERLSKAEALRRLVERRRLQDSSLMVGDTAEDHAASVAAGIPCVIVAHGYGRDLDRLPPPAYHPGSGWREVLDAVEQGKL